MPCDPNQNQINPPLTPPLPGLGFAPIQVPFPDISLPTGLLQDLMDLVNKLGLLFPSSTFKPTVDNFTKVIFDLISNLLTQIAPFLSFYNFIMALLNLIICIIEVLCAIPNPIKISLALVKLFSECLPPFLNLFPWLALIAMIIALLLLILALIEYLIATIIAIIEAIIKNILILASGVSFQDAESTLAAIQKLADLMCLIQNILAILVALAAIIAIIQALAQFAGGAICDGDSTTGCCSSDVCPPFIKDSPLTGTAGQLTYHSQVGADVTTIFSGIPGLPADFNASVFNIPPLRAERWQFVDTALSQAHTFAEIITPVLSATFPPDPSTFWPEGTTYDLNTPPSKAPYTCDLRMSMNPAAFVSDTLGTRFMKVKDCIVVRRPYLGILDYQENLLTSNVTGTLNLEGGLVFEDDGTTPFMVDGYQATLNTFIHLPDILSNAGPAVEDGYVINDIEFTMKPVLPTLMGAQLITAGCLPEVRIEKSIMNNIIIAEDVRSVVTKLQPTPAGQKVPSAGILPNVSGAQQCATDALTVFRKNVTLETAAVFQADVVTCLSDLRDQTVATICGAVIAAVSQFKSEVTLNTDVEFTSRSIKVNVILKDPTGTNIAQSLPADCQGSVLDKLKGVVTLGELVGFVYDGTASFNADIVSKSAGQGTLTVSFDNKIFSTFIAAVPATATAAAVSSSVVENVLDYTFIDAHTEPAVRRDATDVSGNESNKE